MHRLAIVVPCYNEEEVFPETSKRLTEVLKELIEKKKIAEDSFALYVNDGSNQPRPARSCRQQKIKKGCNDHAESAQGQPHTPHFIPHIQRSERHGVKSGRARRIVPDF